MRGTAYAVGEMIAFLVLAGLVGVAIGLVMGWGRQKISGSRPKAAPVDRGAPDRTRRLEAKIRELEAARTEAGDSERRIDALQKELSVAQWQIDALEEELGKQDTPADAG